MSFKKQYLKSKPVCKVTFRMSEENLEGANTVHVVGDFNGWDTYASPMKRLKTGDYVLTMDLKIGREYQYRYLLDGTSWINDWHADKYVRSTYSDAENSVVIL